MISLGKERDISGSLENNRLCVHASGPYWGNHGAGIYVADNWPDCVFDLLLFDGGGGVLHKKSKKILSPAFHWAVAVGAAF